MVAAMADSISLERKRDNVSQIKVIWDDSFPQRIDSAFNASHERKRDGWKVTVACCSDLLVNHGHFFVAVEKMNLGESRVKTPQMAPGKVQGVGQFKVICFKNSEDQ
jgi:hypothetical protein